MRRARAQTPRQETLQFVGGVRIVNGTPSCLRRNGVRVEGRERVFECELPRAPRTGDTRKKLVPIRRSRQPQRVVLRGRGVTSFERELRERRLDVRCRRNPFEDAIDALAEGRRESAAESCEVPPLVRTAPRRRTAPSPTRRPATLKRQRRSLERT